MYCVYIIQSQSSGRYYTGYTSNIRQRLRHHNSGANTSTSKRGPWIIVHSEKFADKTTAWLREQQIKKYKGGEAFKKLLLSSQSGGVA